ncbi:siphovirus Gp157 family protein, partial [Fimbriiglobus ruber]|uniref:siphovirus Gp157 family protein n=1 Tax=Fimbriiglobus ruber TaxID=1908690 RepID=UPI001EE6B181
AVESEDFGDMSDGLTGAEDFRPLCLELAEEAVEREALAEAIEVRIKDLQVRKQRYLAGAEMLRTLILQCMDTRGEKAISSPELTLGITTRSPDVVVTDEAAVPSRFFTPQPPKLDKKALKDAVLTDGEVIDGVSLGNGKISLTIRRK